MNEWKPQLRIPSLPKAEWFLLQALCKRYNLVDSKGKPDITELFTVLLTLGYEVCHYGDGQGEQWLVRLIAEQKERQRDEEAREYPW